MGRQVSEHHIRGWSVVPAAGLQGNGSHERNCSQTPVRGGGSGGWGGRGAGGGGGGGARGPGGGGGMARKRLLGRAVRHCPHSSLDRSEWNVKLHKSICENLTILR